MSTPPNLLASYRTYSYHHVLCVCDSTATAEHLANSTDLEAFFHPLHQDRYATRPVVGRKNPTTPGLDNSQAVGTNATETGNYVVLINGMTDSQLFVDKVSWETILTPQVATADGVTQSSMMQTDGEITIIEPLGMNFFNLLADVSARLNSDPVGLVFLLKTFFVGTEAETTYEIKDSDGNTTTATAGSNDRQSTITNVRPFLFIPIDITSIFSDEGATYSMQVVGVANGVGHLAPIQNIASDVNLRINKGWTLYDTMIEFSLQLNDAYQAYVRDTQTKINEGGINFDLSQQYRFVHYTVEIDPGFNDVLAGTNEIIQTHDSVGAPIIPFKSGMGITEAIDKIMTSCQELIDNKENVTYKVTSRLDSTIDTYNVIYTVERYVYKTMNVSEAIGKAVKPTPGEYMEFDYIFTGHNVDVLDFDLRMDLGLSFWQMLTTAQTMPNQSDVVNGKRQDVARGGGGLYKPSPHGGQRIKTPLFFGSANAENIINNYKNPVSTIGFRAMLNRQAAIENVQCRLKIAGNPQLLDEMLPIDHKYAEQAKQDQTINPNWTKVPTLIKVNVRTPIDQNDLFRGFEPFWYTGYYNLFSVTNHFEGGQFTQDLEMFAIPLEDDTMKLVDGISSELGGLATSVTKTVESVKKQAAAKAGEAFQTLTQAAANYSSQDTTTATPAEDKSPAQLRSERDAHKTIVKDNTGGN